MKTYFFCPNTVVFIDCNFNKVFNVALVFLQYVCGGLGLKHVVCVYYCHKMFHAKLNMTILYCQSPRQGAITSSLTSEW